MLPLFGSVVARHRGVVTPRRVADDAPAPFYPGRDRPRFHARPAVRGPPHEWKRFIRTPGAFRARPLLRLALSAPTIYLFKPLIRLNV